MIIYLMNLYFLTMLAFIFHFIKDNKYKQTFLMFLLFIPVFLISALRDGTIGTDTRNYIRFFESIVSQDFLSLLGGQSHYFETGFLFYNKLIGILTKAPHLFIAVTSFITISFIFVFIKRYSYNPWLSVYLFITLNYYQQSFNAIRQFMAVAIALLGIEYIRKNALIKFSSIIFISSNFHSSTIMLWPFYFLKKIKLTNKVLVLIVGGAIIFYVGFDYLEWIINIIAEGRYYRRLIDAGTGKGRTFAVALVMFIFCFIILQKKKEQNNNLYLWMCLASLICYFFAMKMYIFIRLAELFAIFFIILIPNCISYIDNKKLRATIYFVVIILFFSHYYISGQLIGTSRTVPYQFLF